MMPFWLVSTLFFSLFLETVTIPSSLVTRMIPHPYIQSPNFSHVDFSLARIMQLQAQLHNNMLDTKIIRMWFPLYSIDIELPQGTDYKDDVSVRVALDTGSSLFWVRCYTPVRRKYRPNWSPSYREVPDCSDSLTPQCHNDPTGCICETAYAGDQFVLSRLSYDRLSIKSVIHSGSGISFPGIQFGCALRVDRFDPGFDESFDGMLGLGLHPSSILSQIEASEFSYCIGEFTPPKGFGDVLMIGPNEWVGTVIPPDLGSTGFASSTDHYQVTLVGITFGDTWISLEIAEADTLFDLGSSMSALQPFAYNALFSHISDWMQQKSFPVGPPAGKMICYLGTLEDLKDEFPHISYHFAGPAVLELDKSNLFMEVIRPNRICLNLIHPVHFNATYNLVGNSFQKNHYMKYDLVNKRIHMKMMDCAAVFEDLSDDYDN